MEECEAGWLTMCVSACVSAWQEDSKAAVKKALQELHIEGASEVVGLQELRTDYKQYQDRRTLRDGESGAAGRVREAWREGGGPVMKTMFMHHSEGVPVDYEPKPISG